MTAESLWMKFLAFEDNMLMTLQLVCPLLMARSSDWFASNGL